MKTLTAGKRAYVKSLFYDFGKPGEYRFSIKGKTDKPKK